eukprot:COSAG02_NODE_2814_length_7971_cov_4.403455_3_plen_260_part_00
MAAVGGSGEDDSWLATATPATDLCGIRWSTLDKVATSDSGSAGVIFCRCSSGTFVIKGCATVAQEMFSAQLARVLGVRAPRARLVSWPGNEWQMLQKHVKRHLLRRGLNDPSAATVRRKVEKELDRPHILIFELVPGVGLDSMLPQDLAEKLKGSGGIRAIGAVCALDVLLNNADRLPPAVEQQWQRCKFDVLRIVESGGCYRPGSILHPERYRSERLLALCAPTLRGALLILIENCRDAVASGGPNVRETPCSGGRRS